MYLTKKGLALIVGLFLVMALASFAFFFIGNQSFLKLFSTKSKQSSGYQNPFQLEQSKYENPFSDYANPFEDLK